MKIYKVSYITHSDNSDGFSYHASKVEAEKALAKFKKLNGDDFVESEIDVIETPITGKAIIQLLNQLATHNDNG